MTLALVGNPNSGKTTLFNRLTGLQQHVGNFPGVTVERMEGALSGRPSVTVVDLPGAYSLRAFSKEEDVASGYLRDHPPDAILNIVDATCPERGLYLTMQLLPLGIPMAVALNMMDEVEAGGGKVDVAALAKGLGVPVVPIVASKGEGVLAAADAALSAPKRRAQASPKHMTNVISSDDEEAQIIARYRRVEALVARAVTAPAESRAQRLSRRADTILTSRHFAFPIFFIVLGLVFYLTYGPVGGALARLFARGLSAFSAWIGASLSAIGAAEWLRGLIVDGILAGAGSVLSFLPTILTLFFLLSLLEDSGYMARMAFVTDRLLRKIGLSGRSFVPALLGFGCSVPAILATRTLPTKRDRRMTVLLVPFLSCSAKAPIYALFAGAFFPAHAALATVALYAGGVLVGIPAALMLKKAAFPGNAPPFLLELPAYRMPTARSALMLVRTRTLAFVKCALTTLLLASIAVWALGRVSFSLQPVANSADSALAGIGRLLSPLFLPLGFGDWRAATALLTGLMAKEGVLASFSILLAPGGLPLPDALRVMFTPLQAVSFLTFTLLYTPCIAAFAAARRELGGLRYALLGALFQCGVAWACAFLVYNVGRVLGFL